jgi:hypothetical protein
LRRKQRQKWFSDFKFLCSFLQLMWLYKLKSLGFLSSCCKWVHSKWLKRWRFTCVCVCVCVYIKQSGLIWVYPGLTSPGSTLRVDRVLPGQISGWFFLKRGPVPAPGQLGQPGWPAGPDRVLKLCFRLTCFNFIWLVSRHDNLF